LASQVRGWQVIARDGGDVAEDKSRGAGAGRFGLFDPETGKFHVLGSSPGLAAAMQEWSRYVQSEQAKIAFAAVDNALKAVPPAAKAELAQLSEQTREDLRLQLLEGLEKGERDMWAAVLAMRSTETTGSRLLIATWGLVVSSVGLVIATVALVVVTLSQHP
jgi:hypothetical protein